MLAARRSAIAAGLSHNKVSTKVSMRDTSDSRGPSRHGVEP